MLTKQWQMGEFRGSDAGSPVFAKAFHGDHAADQVSSGRRRRATFRLDDSV